MKYFTVLILLSVSAVIYGQSIFSTCEARVENLCRGLGKAEDSIRFCNSITVTHPWNHSEKRLQKYAKNTLKRSYELLGLAINHGSFSRNRAGFEKLFRQLSDTSFNNAIKIMKYITGRGGSVKFNYMQNAITMNKFNINEFESMAAAQTIEKELLEFAQGFANVTPDPNTLHFIEEEFIKPKTDVVYKLTGYVHDLDKLVQTTDSSFNIYMFDQYLQKSMKHF